MLSDTHNHDWSDDRSIPADRVVLHNTLINQLACNNDDGKVRGRQPLAPRTARPIKMLGFAIENQISSNDRHRLP